VAAFVSVLREGDFLTRDRIRLWTLAVLIGFAAGIAMLVVTARGVNDYQGRPLGTDFSSFYAAGQLTLEGQSPYDQRQLHHRQQRLFGQDTPYYAFSYPPIFLLIIAPLAKLSYPAALMLWEGLGLLLYAAAMLRLRRKYFAKTDDILYLAAALAFTTTFVNLTHGQNGFLSAGLVALALSFLDENDALAGLCFGLLAFKPQLGLLIPFALAAGGYWRAFASATACVVIIGVMSLFAFGLSDWQGFWAATLFSQQTILDQGAVGYEKMISVFAWMRLWGVPLSLSYLAQMLVSLSVAAGIFWLWRSHAGLRLKGAALCVGMLLATPFAVDYDMMLLAPAIALLAFEGMANGFRPYERTLLAMLWIVPIAARNVAGYSHVPVAVFLTLTTFAVLLARGGSAGIVRRTEIPA
jgi:hypothetical protein